MIQYEYGKLRGRIVEKFGTLTNFAKELGVADSVISYKLNNVRDITKSDIFKWSELLDINSDEYGTYFFCRKS